MASTLTLTLSLTLYRAVPADRRQPPSSPSKTLTACSLARQHSITRSQRSSYGYSNSNRRLAFCSSNSTYKLQNGITDPLSWSWNISSFTASSCTCLLLFFWTLLVLRCFIFCFVFLLLIFLKNLRKEEQRPHQDGT